MIRLFSNLSYRHNWNLHTVYDRKVWNVKTKSLKQQILASAKLHKRRGDSKGKNQSVQLVREAVCNLVPSLSHFHAYQPLYPF
jgi:hypothetical protein